MKRQFKRREFAPLNPTVQICRRSESDRSDRKSKALSAARNETNAGGDDSEEELNLTLRSVCDVTKLFSVVLVKLMIITLVLVIFAAVFLSLPHNADLMSFARAKPFL